MNGTKNEKIFLNPQYNQNKVYTQSKNDPLFKYQWHLKNTGQSFGITNATAGEDINIESVWDEGITGKGVTVGVIDTGVDMFHPDLKDNIDWENSYNYHNGKNNPTPSGESGTDEAHATAVAGLIAAKGWNGIGTRGVAPDAKIASLNALEVYENEISELGYSSLYLQEVRLLDALTRNLDSIDIYNNSWSGDESSLLDDVNASLMGIGANEFDTQTDYGVKFGRNGLGAIYVKSAGNGGSNSNANFNQIATNGNWIVVGALGADGKATEYSTPGSAILVSAPGGAPGANNPPWTKENELMIVTTDLAGDKRGYDIEDRLATIQPHFDVKGNENYDYTNRMNGTSAAAPIVSGVVALMLETNPNLTYRDIQIILAKTARKNDPNDSDWQTNAAGLHFNYKYGFGAVDAKAAVEMAKNWQSVGDYYTQKRISKSYNQQIKSNKVIIPFEIDNNFIVENVSVILTIDNQNYLTYEYDSENKPINGLNITLYEGLNYIYATLNSPALLTINQPSLNYNNQISLIPPNDTKIIFIPQTITCYFSLSPNQNINYYIRIKTPFVKNEAKNYKITLTSPSGTTSTLVDAPNSLTQNDSYQNTRLLSTNFLGESSAGKWILTIEDISGRELNFKNAILTLTGH